MTSVPVEPWIDESTPVPGTLNELLPVDLTREDPGVFEDEHSVFEDEHGPFRIGEPIAGPTTDPVAQCRAALHNLALLGEAWPVYRDEQGKLRHQWARDPYRGARQYLDNNARQQARAAAEQMQSRACAAARAAGVEVASVSAVREDVLRAALCEAERAELLALENVIGSTEDARARKRALVTSVCGEASVSTP
jgi:hypothetical protein